MLDGCGSVTGMITEPRKIWYPFSGGGWNISRQLVLEANRDETRELD